MVEGARALDAWSDDALRGEIDAAQMACRVYHAMTQVEAPHPPHPDGPRFPFVPHRKGEPYWLTDGYGYSAEVSALRWWWQRAKQKLGVIG